MEREVLDSVTVGYARLDLIERLLSAFADRKWLPSRSTLETVTLFAERWRLPMLKAQLMRLSGDFENAAEIFSAFGSLPYASRARIELAESRGVAPDPESVALLQRLGDIEYLESHQVSSG
jgi:hypothetical protein